jgi:hypothetical protein
MRLSWDPGSMSAAKHELLLVNSTNWSGWRYSEGVDDVKNEWMVDVKRPRMLEMVDNGFKIK